MPSLSAHEILIESFKLIKMHLASGLKQQSLGNFTSPPRSCTLACGDYKKKKEGGNKRACNDDVETGRLRYAGNKKFPDLPSLQECRMCKECVTIGLSYVKSNQTRCRYGVHVSYQRLTREDKKIITDYCSNSRTLALEGWLNPQMSLHICLPLCLSCCLATCFLLKTILSSSGFIRLQFV